MMMKMRRKLFRLRDNNFLYIYGISRIESLKVLKCVELLQTIEIPLRFEKRLHC